MIRAILWVILTAVLLVGGCTQFLWWDYQNHMPNPCGRAGEARRYTGVEQYAQQGSNYGAMCGGFTSSGRYVSYQARGR